MSQYLQEAFKRFDLLEEEDFNMDASGIDELKSFLDDDKDNIDFTDVIDPEAETEEELEDSYIGKVILECKVCHSKIYKNAEDVHFNEETELANEDEECPFCYAMDGFEIVGQVAPYEETEVKVDVEPKEDEVEVEETEDDEKNESFKSRRNKRLNESNEDEEFDIPDELWNRLPSVVKNGLNNAWNSNKTNKWFDPYLQALVDIGIISEEDKNVIIKSNSYYGYDESLKEGIFDNKKQDKNQRQLQIDEKNLKIYANKLLAKGMDKADFLNAVKETTEGSDFTRNYDKNYARQYLRIASKVADSVFTESLKEEAGKVNYVEITNIDWDTDDEKVDLPSTETLPIEDLTDADDGELVEEEIADWLSDQYGWCVNGFNYEFKYDKVFDESLKESFIIDLTDYDYPGEHYFQELNSDGLPLSTKNKSKAKRFNSRGEALSFAKEYIVAQDEELPNIISEGLENLDIETEHDRIHVEAEEKEPTGEEVIAPIEPAQEEDILSDETSEDTVDEVPQEPEEEIDVDEFDEESFDNMGESYLKKVYGNVNSFKTTSIKESGNGFILEGVINFKSGKNKKTSFKFEAKDISPNGKVRFIGENLQFSKGKKAFTLKGTITNNKFISESLNYNYRVDGNRVYGTVKNKSLKEDRMSDVEGSASNAMSQKEVMQKLNDCKTPQEVKALVNSVIPENRKNEPKVKKLFANLDREKDVVRAMTAVTNFILKGDGLGSIDKQVSGKNKF